MMADQMPVNPGAAPGVMRPQPTDPPGDNAGGWVKITSPPDGGWDAVDGMSGSGWTQT